MRLLSILCFLVLGLAIGVHSGRTPSVTETEPSMVLMLAAGLLMFWVIISGLHKLWMLITGEGSIVLGSIALAIWLVVLGICIVTGTSSHSTPATSTQLVCTFVCFFGWAVTDVVGMVADT